MPHESIVLQALQAPVSAPSRAHLADYSFRFDTHAATGAPALPASGHDWSPAQTLGELRRRGANLDRSSRGLRVRHAHRMPQLAVAVGRHERLVETWLAQRSDAPPALGWDDEADALVRWVQALPAPSEAVEIGPGVRIVDWSRFLTSVVGRYAEGPHAPGAPSLRRDLRMVFQAQPVAEVRPLRMTRPARAA